MLHFFRKSRRPKPSEERPAQKKSSTKRGADSENSVEGSLHAQIELALRAIDNYRKREEI